MSNTEDSWEDDEETQAIVIDNGSGTIKAGFAGAKHPKITFPTIISRIKGSSSTDTYIGKEALTNKDGLDLIIQHPIQNGLITSWDDMENIWHYTFYNQLKIEPEEHCVLLTEIPLNPKANKEKYKQIMFETFNVPAMYTAIQAVLALYASGRSTGIILDSGYDKTHSVPIYEGYALPHAIFCNHNICGKNITNKLMKIFNLKNDVAKAIKEEICYIAPIRKYMNDREYKYKLPDGEMINIGSETFKCTEQLFECQGINQMIYDSVMKCDKDIRKDLFENIVLSGGNMMFKGIELRLQNEMRNSLNITTKVDGYIRRYFKNNTILSQDVVDLIYKNLDEIKIIVPPERSYSAWIGGSILSSMSTFQEMWLTKDEYDECGPSFVRRRYEW